MGPFDRAPFIVIWETTRACALACVHCRAEAMPQRDPRELTTDEGRALMDRVVAFGDPPPLLVLTGGDPLRRPDIVELVAYGSHRGLSVSLTPSGTAAVTEARLRALRDAGLARLAVSLDGATAEAHDAFRGVVGSHHHTLKIVERTRALGLPLQINTTVCRRTVGDLPALARQVEEFGAVLWALFFLIPVGRADAGEALGPNEIEAVLEWAAGLGGRVPFGVKTTEAPQFHRVLAQRRGPGAPASGGRGERPAVTDTVRRAGRAVTDGNGFVFVVNPAGAKSDTQIANEGRDVNTNWDAVWNVATTRSENGWTAEIRIPFKTLRFERGADRIWGVNFSRHIRRKNEVDYWSPVPRVYNLYRASMAGTLGGLPDASQGRNLRVKPWIAADVTRGLAGDDFDRDAHAGLDVKYGVTPSLTLVYDWGGAFVAQPAVTFSRDPFRFNFSYSYLTADHLFGGSGVSLLRDRDNVLFQIEYVI